jgi:hypothetical protein
MIDYGEVHSTVEPEKIDIKETKVFVATNIEEEVIYAPEGLEAGTKEVGYKYHLVEYDKNEYITMMSIKDEQLESELSNAQMALCELYELVEVS